MLRAVHGLTESGISIRRRRVVPEDALSPIDVDTVTVGADARDSPTRTGQVRTLARRYAATFKLASLMLM